MKTQPRPPVSGLPPALDAERVDRTLGLGPSKRPRPIGRWVLLGLVLAAGSFAVWRWATRLPEVTVIHAEIRDIWTSFTAEGVVRGTEYPVGAEAGGRVTELSVREGAPVRRGQLLFQLNAEQPVYGANEAAEAYRAAVEAVDQAVSQKRLVVAQYSGSLAAAQARVRQAELAHQRLLKGVRSEEIDQAVQNVARAAAALEESERAFRRAESLFRADVIARAVVERAEASYKAAQADFALAKSRESQLRAGPSPEEIAVSQAAIDAAQAGLNQAHGEAGQIEVAERAIDVAKSRVRQAKAASQRAQAGVAMQSVRAPADGFVTKLNVEEGSVILPGVAALVVSSREDLRVEAEISTEDSSKIEPGMDVTVTAAAYPGRTFGAKVRSVLPIGELKPDAAIRIRIVRAQITLRQSPGLFRPGMEVDVEGRKRLGRRVAVPTDALRYSGASASVFVLAGGKVEERTVRLGNQDPVWTEVLSGVAVGETVIVRGKDELKAGDSVRAVR